MSDTLHDPRPLPASLRGDLKSASTEELSQLFAGIASQTVDREPSWRDRLRELPTTTRVVAAVGMAAALGAARLALGGVRGDLAGGIMHFGLIYGALSMVGIGAATLTLRSMHTRPLHMVAWRLAGLAAALPLVVALIPFLNPGLHTTDGAALSIHFACGATGLFVGSAAAAIVLLFAREDHPSDVRLLAAAGSGGLFGWVVQGAHCPLVDLEHLVFAHSLYGGAIWLVLLAWFRARPNHRSA